MNGKAVEFGFLNYLMIKSSLLLLELVFISSIPFAIVAISGNAIIALCVGVICVLGKGLTIYLSNGYLLTLLELLPFGNSDFYQLLDNNVLINGVNLPLAAIMSSVYYSITMYLGFSIF